VVLNLPSAIARFVDASNTRDVDAFVSCFAAEAVVEDEGRTHRGVAEVRAWKKETEDRYRYTITPSNLEQRNGETILKATLDGNFPGSPADLFYEFTIVDEAIEALRIHP
jgi:hypothetical protein